MTKKRGQNLASLLENVIEDHVTDDRSRADIIEEMATAAGIAPDTVNEIVNNSINCPPLVRLEGFASVLDVSLDTLISAAREDGCEPVVEERANNIFQKFWHDMVDLISGKGKERKIVDVDSWDGSASNYSSTQEFCNASLINVNEASGRTDSDEWVQSHCKLPVRREEDSADTFVRQAVFAAAGGRGITQVEKPDDVPQEAWDTAVKNAADDLIKAYEEMEETAPDSVFEAAGKEPERAKHEDEEEEHRQRATSLGMVWDAVWVQADAMSMQVDW